MTRYLNRFADKFSLLARIQLNTEVKRLDKSGKKWLVTYTSPATQCKDKQEEFDNVVIATGAFGFPRYPEIYATRDQFNGLIIHSAQVRNDEKLFKDKRILFIGGGYSGGDMATVAVESGARQVYIVPTHRPNVRNVWTLNRVTPRSGGGERVWDYQCTRQNSIVTSEFGAMFTRWLYPLHKTSDKASLKFPGDCLGICDVDVMDSSLKNGKIKLVENAADFQGLTHNRVLLYTRFY